MRHRFITLTKSQKMQSKQWKHPRFTPPKTFKSVHSAGKMMASIIWDSQWVIMIDYLEQGRTINSAHYAGELRRLCQKSQERGKSDWPTVFCSRRTMPLPTCHILLWLLRLSVDLESFLIPHILLICFLCNSICSNNWNSIFVVHSMEAMNAP